MNISEESMNQIAGLCHELQGDLAAWMKAYGTSDENNRMIPKRYVKFITGRPEILSRWDDLCNRISNVGPAILSGIMPDQSAAQLLEMLPEYVELRILCGCQSGMFAQSVYDDLCEGASFRRFVVGETQYGTDAPELGLDVTDDTITFFVREDKKRLISRDSFSKLSMFMERVDAGFKKCRRGRLDQYQIVVNNAYDDVGAYVNRVASIIAKLSDSKVAIAKALLGS